MVQYLRLMRLGVGTLFFTYDTFATAEGYYKIPLEAGMQLDSRPFQTSGPFRPLFTGLNGPF